MKDKIVEILQDADENGHNYYDTANTIDQLYEQERRNAFARGVDWLMQRIHVPQSETS